MNVQEERSRHTKIAFFVHNFNFSTLKYVVFYTLFYLRGYSVKYILKLLKLIRLKRCRSIIIIVLYFTLGGSENGKYCRLIFNAIFKCLFYVIKIQTLMCTFLQMHMIFRHTSYHFSAKCIYMSFKKHIVQLFVR